MVAETPGLTSNEALSSQSRTYPGCNVHPIHRLLVKTTCSRSCHQTENRRAYTGFISTIICQNCKDERHVDDIGPALGAATNLLADGL